MLQTSGYALFPRAAKLGYFINKYPAISGSQLEAEKKRRNKYMTNGTLEKPGLEQTSELKPEMITSEFLAQETKRINALKEGIDPGALAKLEEQFTKMDNVLDSYTDGVEDRNPVDYLKLVNREHAFIETQGVDKVDVRQKIEAIRTRESQLFGIIDQLRNKVNAEKDQKLREQMSEIFNRTQMLAREVTPVGEVTEKRTVITAEGEKPVTTLERMDRDLQVATEQLSQDKIGDITKAVDQDLAKFRPYEAWIGKLKLNQATALGKNAKAYELLATQTRGQPGADKIAEQAADYARRYERLKTEMTDDANAFEERRMREKIDRELTRRAYSQPARGL